MKRQNNDRINGEGTRRKGDIGKGGIKIEETMRDREKETEKR